MARGKTLGTGYRNSHAGHDRIGEIGRVAGSIKLPEAYAESVIDFDR
jgi:hypothetical protein